MGRLSPICPLYLPYFIRKETGKTTLKRRNASTGRFTPVERVRRLPDSHVVERVPKPGYGDTRKK